MFIPSVNNTDGYKTSHYAMMPPGTNKVFANFTNRSSRRGLDKVVTFGLQYFVKRYLMRDWNENFFNQPKEKVIKAHKRRLDNYLGKDKVSMDHIAALHDKQYLPLEIRALPEGSLVPLKVPAITVENTTDDSYWLTNYIETNLSDTIWFPSSSATTALLYRRLLDSYAAKTSDIPEFVDVQAHDFSMRGHTSLESACVSGMGHLLSFTGTDTIPAIDYLEQYYNADSDKEVVGVSVPASEHSVMTFGGREGEAEIIKRLIQVVYPDGVVSLVCDSYDFFKTINETIRGLKDEILARNGTLVIRPDSGDPVEIVCGNPDSGDELEQKGAIQLLWEIFGGRVNCKGYKQLDSHVGVIYGDSITLDRAYKICDLLEQVGFASTNVVFGVGSFTYQYLTRDTDGSAMKTTYGEVNHTGINIFKDPKTDSGFKKSARGLLAVLWKDGNYELVQEASRELQQSGWNMLQPVFRNGQLLRDHTLSEIRNRLRSSQ